MSHAASPLSDTDDACLAGRAACAIARLRRYPRGERACNVRDRTPAGCRADRARIVQLVPNTHPCDAFAARALEAGGKQ